MHNKPDTMPLCGSTRSGKLINRIINESGLEKKLFLKTNLYDVDYFPIEYLEKNRLAIDWHERIEPDLKNDVIILMGAEVHENFVYDGMKNVIKIAHPSSKRSHADMNEYVSKTIEKIKSFNG